MSIEIVSEKENLLFSRKEIILAGEFDSAPSNEESKKIVADKFKADPELVRIQKIEGKFGTRIFRIIADIYSSKEEFNRLVKKTKKELDDEKKAEEARKAAEEEARKKAEEEAKAKEEAAKAESEGSEEKEEEVSEDKKDEEKKE